MKLSIATCYLPVDSDIGWNRDHVLRQMRVARQRGAQIAHFPECCLSGYAGVDFDSYDGFDWALLEKSMHAVLEAARELRIWIVLGSTHRLTGKNKPHNSVFVIDNRGEIVDRYDKMFCAGDLKCQTGDLSHYTSGDHFSTFEINGIKCGVLICHDYRYPELYREYKRLGVQVMFHSYHAGHVTPKNWKMVEKQVGARYHRLNRASTLPGITMPAAMQTAAATNYVYISCSNTSARQSCWPAFFVRPDGVITGKLRVNTSGVLITNVDTEEQFYDSTVAWRDRAMNGVFHSGELVVDERSANRKCV